MQIFGKQIRFGIHAGQQNSSLNDYVNLWKTAEDLGYDWASVFDHFLPIHTDPGGPCFESLSLLSALAAQTSHIRCGVMALSSTYRHPAVLAKVATTIDHISNGRVELGIGAGWYDLEHHQYGIPFPSLKTRVQMLGETATILKSLWTQPRTNFNGVHFQLENAVCEPKGIQEPHIPLWIGGAGERLTLRIVAESADGWNTFLCPLATYKHKLAALADHCAAVGRNPSDIRKSLVVLAVIGETESEVEQQGRRLAAMRHTTVDALRERTIFGSPEQCAQQLLDYVRLGVTDFLIGARPPTEKRVLELIARHVIPIVTREGIGALPQDS